MNPGHFIDPKRTTRNVASSSVSTTWHIIIFCSDKRSQCFPLPLTAILQRQDN